MIDPPIYINVRDRCKDLPALVGWLERAGHERIVFIDNDSQWPPLLEYLEATPHQVIRTKNLGSRSVWLIPDLALSEWFVFTDPDLVPIEACPSDAVQHMYEVAMRYQAAKVGLGLYLDDAPADLHCLDWERTLVEPHLELEPGVYQSLVDTTFALYRPWTQHFLPALRLGAPYQVRHMPWYSTELDDEDLFYLRRARTGPLGSSWAQVADF